MVWCLRLKTPNGAVVDGTIVVFYGTRDRLVGNSVKTVKKSEKSGILTVLDRFSVLRAPLQRLFHLPGA